MKEILLGSATPVQFAAALVIAYITAFTMMLIGTTKRDINSTRTPFCWSWEFFTSDNFKRILGNILLIILVIRFSQKWVPAEYIAYGAAIVGLLSDKLSVLILKLQEKLAAIGNSKIDKL